MFVVVETLVGCFRVRNRYEGEIRIFYFQFSFPIFAIVDSLTSLKKMLNGSVYSERSLSGGLAWCREIHGEAQHRQNKGTLEGGVGEGNG